MQDTHQQAAVAVAQTHQLPDDGSWQGDILQEIAVEHARARKELMTKYVSLKAVAKALGRETSNLRRTAKKLGIGSVLLRTEKGQQSTYFEKAEALRLARLLGGQEE